MKSSASQRRRRLRFIYLVRSYPGGYVTADTASRLGATSTSPGQQLTRHVVARGFGHVSTDPSPSLRPKRQLNAPLTSRQGFPFDVEAPPTFACPASNPQYVAYASQSVPILFLHRRFRRPLGHRRCNGECLAFHPSFYLSTRGPRHPAPRLPSGPRLRAGLHGARHNGTAQTIQILSKSSTILRRQGWWTVPRQTASPHDLTRFHGARAFFIRLV